MYDEKDMKEHEEMMAKWRNRISRPDYSQYDAIAGMAGLGGAEPVLPTPRPWSVEYGAVYVAGSVDAGLDNRIALMDRDNPMTTPTERDANAKFIVMAANAHDKLVQALSAINELASAHSDDTMSDYPVIQRLAQTALAEVE